MYIVKKFFRQIFKFFYWGWKLRNNEDWDYFYLFQILQFKLERIEKAILEDPWHIWTEKKKKRLRIAINCLKRLQNENTYWIDSGIDIDFRKPLTEKQSKDLKRKWDKENLLKKQDLDWVFEIIKKEHRNWWI